jgi:RimJ/RimL family protein N-acetyltransferase
MDVLTFTDADAFAELVGPVIDRHPAFASVLATNLDQNRFGPGFDSHWFLIRDGEQPVGAAMCTQAYSLFLTPTPEAGLPALAEAVQRAGLTPPGVTGPEPVAQAFGAAWNRLTGLSTRPAGRDRLYEIEVAPPLPASGAARLATEADLVLATQWMNDFQAEALPGEPVDAEHAFRRRLARGRLLFWEVDGRPVSMAGISRPIASVARVGSVFTPKANRGKGFGSAVTIAATRQGLADGAGRCILYADLANPISNRVYLAIGFRPVGDSSRLAFVE